MKKKNIVYIKDATNLNKEIAEVFKELDYKGLKNKKIFIKPNMLRAAAPEECITTNPKLVNAVVSYLLKSGAHISIGDNPAPDKNKNETEIAKKCGIYDAAQGRFRNIGRYTKKIRLKGNLLKSVYISREITECDMLLSLPKFKPHELTMMSVALKNHFGIIPGGLKPYIHSQYPDLNDFCKILLQIYEMRPPNLIIVDCINIIDAKGRKFSPNKIIVGENGYAVDYVCAKMAGVNPNAIPLLKLAIEGRKFNPEQVEISGKIEALKKYAMPLNFPFRNSLASLVCSVVYRLQNKRVPIIDTSKCTGCRSCENVCPKRAIKNNTIDYDECIRCFCCIEVCPNRAIKMKFRR